MAKKFSVSWTKEAKTQVDSILEYLNQNWSEKSAEDFLDLLLHFEKTINQFPKSFKASAKFKGCRLGLVHPHITAVYKIIGDEIIIVTVFDNRSSAEK